MDNAIWGSVVGAAATIFAALINGGIFRNTIRKEIVPNFFSYSEPHHDLWPLLRSAKEEIIIVVAYGDRLLKGQKEHLECLLKRGIRIKYLMLDPGKALEMGTSFIYPTSPLDYVLRARRLEAKAEISDALSSLEMLQRSVPGGMEIRMTSLPLTASYIAIDLPTRVTNPSRCNALIQMMVYQFGVMPENSPIAYLRFKNEKEKLPHCIYKEQACWLLCLHNGAWACKAWK